MGKVYPKIDAELTAWIEQQRLFFVSTAPLSADGLINSSPKGLDSFAVLGPTSVAYADLNGSGIETAAHLRENGRITMMFCAFAGPPLILRLHGEGRYHVLGTADFERLADRFASLENLRGIVEVSLTRIADSCGYGVPKYEYAGERAALVKWAAKEGPEGLAAYRAKKNRVSLDGLPGI